MIELTYRDGITERVDFEGMLEEFLEWREGLRNPPELRGVIKIEEVKCEVQIV